MNTNEEIEIPFWNDKLTQELLKIKQQILSDPKMKVIPLWYKQIERIVLPEKLEWERPNPAYECIIQNVNLEVLISKLDCGNSPILRQKLIFGPRFYESKTCKIVQHWKQRKRIIPPHIMLYNNSQLMLEDGRHRANIAYYFGAKEISIKVDKAYESQVRNILFK